MNRDTLSFLAWVLGLALFATFFWRARAVRRDAASAGRETERTRKRWLNWILVAGCLALAAAALL